jgi:dipeptidase
VCDSFVAMPDSTVGGAVIFGKNSDREPNEAEELLVLPHGRHVSGSSLRATYIEIPQIRETHAVLLARPYWTWGAEMGANEHGLAVGNQALFTRVPHEKTPGLIGMDLVRLALERAATAREAVSVITGLLEVYGQSGNCGHRRRFEYHNSFLIADPGDAWVLETAGREWAAKRISSGVYSISNAITIGNRFDSCSPGLVRQAVRQGWCRGEADFDFARCYSRQPHTRLSAADERRACATAALEPRRGQVSVADATALLRSHETAAGRCAAIDRGLTGRTVCNHAGFGPARWSSQAVGSMVSELRAGGATHWLTGTSAPCTSIFKPVWIDSGLPDLGPPPTGRFDAASYWWRHELLHRGTLLDFHDRLRLYAVDRDALEADFRLREQSHRGLSDKERAALTAFCFTAAEAAAERWLRQITPLPVRSRPGLLHGLAWKSYDRDAGMPGRRAAAAPSKQEG